ncbi:Vps52 / Sac2 family [Actinidia rufa]|uniref:Vps52 / Sac2 family n=1 Tax=Actinidia rufa TaxID=165716 RepID=A0A7J0GZV1_9ERIC|nr:Vps52 / Sac2 family [Actinidia rufa]
MKSQQSEQSNNNGVDDTTVWEEYERTHKGVSGMNGKAFPMFDDWQTLFGHDRATGEMAEDAPEVPDVTPVQTPGLDDTWNDCYSPRYASGEPLFVDGIFVDVTGDDPNGNVNPSTPRGNVNPSTQRGNVNHSTPRGNPSTAMANIPVPERPKKKAKLDAIHEMMKGFIAQNNAHMEKIDRCCGENRRTKWLYVCLKGDQNATCGKIPLEASPEASRKGATLHFGTKEELLLDYFSDFIKFVKTRASEDPTFGSEIAIEVEPLAKDFASRWKAAIELMHNDVITSFSNFLCGMEILRAALTHLLLYYTRLLDCIKRIVGGSALNKDLVFISSIMYEIRKYYGTWSTIDFMLC